MRIRQGKRIGGPTFDENERLQRLDCRTRIDQPLDIADSHGDLTIAMDHSDRTAVATFNHLTACNFHQDRVGIHKWEV